MINLSSVPINKIAYRVRFYFLDGYIAAPILLTMLWPRMTTLYVLLVLSGILFLLERKGMNLPMLLRKIRCFFVGRKRVIRPWWRSL
ncbi:hypothetical protein D3C81_563800 [compost metagenome]